MYGFKNKTHNDNNDKHYHIMSSIYMYKSNTFLAINRKIN